MTLLIVGIIEKYKNKVCCVYLDEGTQHVVVTQEAQRPAGNQQLSSRLQVRHAEEVLGQPTQFGYLLISNPRKSGVCWLAHVPPPANSFA